jgi:hypothetical protein
VTHVQSPIFSDPCTFCRARRVRHVIERYPPFSRVICRSQSNLTFGIRSSRVSFPINLRCSHVILGMVHTWTNTVQVAGLSSISIENPSYCSTVHTESGHEPPFQYDSLKVVYSVRMYYYIRIIQSVLPCRHRRLLPVLLT